MELRTQLHFWCEHQAGPNCYCLKGVVVYYLGGSLSQRKKETIASVFWHFSKWCIANRVLFFVLFDIIRYDITEETVDIHVTKNAFIEEEMILLNGICLKILSFWKVSWSINTASKLNKRTANTFNELWLLMYSALLLINCSITYLLGFELHHVKDKI